MNIWSMSWSTRLGMYSGSLIIAWTVICGPSDVDWTRRLGMPGSSHGEGPHGVCGPLDQRFAVGLGDRAAVRRPARRRQRRVLRELANATANTAREEMSVLKAQLAAARFEADRAEWVRAGVPPPPRAVRSRKRALGIRISQEMIDRNEVDRVNVQISQVRNTLVRDFDTMFFNGLLAATSVGLHTLAVATPWATSTTIRRNALTAVRLITDEKRGFIPDTLIVNPSTRIDLISSGEINQTFQGNAADRAPLLTGKLDFGFVGLDSGRPTRCPPGRPWSASARSSAGSPTSASCRPPRCTCRCGRPRQVLPAFAEVPASVPI